MEGALSRLRRALAGAARRARIFAALLALVALALPAPAIELPAFVEVPATPQQLRALRDGGYVLFMRHGQTDNGIQDRLPSPDPADCATQRPLSEPGRKAVARVGAAMRRMRIPLGEVFVSPMCRTRESAELAFGSAYRIEWGLMHLLHMTPAEKDKVMETTRRLLSTPVAAGSNRMLVAHASNLTDLNAYFPAEATVAIFRPRDKGAFDYVASIPLQRWDLLLR